jgi:hypothetical protein
MDKKNRPCCYMTGRDFDPMIHRRNHLAFEKFLLEMVETGCTLAKGIGAESVALVYDRRELTYDNIDPILFQKMKITVSNLKKFYSGWISVIYIIHVSISIPLFRLPSPLSLELILIFFLSCLCIPISSFAVYEHLQY